MADRGQHRFPSVILYFPSGGQNVPLPIPLLPGGGPQGLQPGNAEKVRHVRPDRAVPAVEGIELTERREQATSGVGDALPDMPVFLTADRYVPCPLEATYQASWDVFPAPLREPLLAPPDPSK